MIVKCDRCHEEADGYYEIDNPRIGWGKLAGATGNERVICDRCMKKSSGYIAAFGERET